MALVGYARVSSPDQSLDAQVSALEAAGCVKVFTDKASGKLDRRPGLDEALAYLRPGDTLTITKLDRLGRTVKGVIALAEDLHDRGVDLKILHQAIDTSTSMGKFFFTVMAAFAEMERELIVERTKDGLAEARARGRRGGRPSKITPTKLTTAREMYASKRYTVQEIADTVGVSRATLYRHLAPVEAEQPLMAVHAMRSGAVTGHFHAVDAGRGAPLHDVAEYGPAGGKPWADVPAHQRCEECQSLAQSS